jgi:hypothetical protein
MDKFVNLQEKLVNCYIKIPHKKYFFLPEEIQEQTCLKERNDLTEFLNSDRMNFDNILKDRVEFLEGNNFKEIFIYF